MGTLSLRPIEEAPGPLPGPARTPEPISCRADPAQSRHGTDRVHADGVQTYRVQTDRVQTGRVQTDRVQIDRGQTDKARTEPRAT